MTALSVALLSALLVARATRRLRVTPRPPPPPGYPGRRRRRRRVERNYDYAPMLTAIARQVRSGASLTAALIDETDPSTPFGAIVVRLGDGAPLSEALTAVQSHDAAVALTAQALSACAHLGGPVAATLDEAAAVLRERSAARAERIAQGSQARLSARVLTIVPLAFALWSAVASQRTRDIYLASAAGAVCAGC